MIDMRRAILDALPKDLLLDLEDRLRAEAHKAHEIVRRELPLNAKRSREAEGQIRFRLQEQGYEEVVQAHGGHLLVNGVMLGTDLKVFQPFARFAGPDIGVVLGFATMPERRKVPPKNMSRAAGVTLNLHLQPSLLDDENTPRPTDMFALFLTARDRERAGLIEEIAIGVIGSDYQDFIFYESLEKFMGGYAADPVEPTQPDPSEEGLGKIVKLRQTRKPFVPPERKPDNDAEEGTAS
ncbi:hypothetical protein [Novosphingobium rosa]|jgi:hypothetical protein|uniref:hypothetical protein n=1 Tax=Novosphingobium rosa TaxID=76978 RepID=UPI00082CDD58|nr:hypothetical protein [Novosphingobium rosa]